MRARSRRPRGAVPDDTRKAAWLAAIAIAALTAGVYAGVAGHRFIGIDDPEYIVMGLDRSFEPARQARASLDRVR